MASKRWPSRTITVISAFMLVMNVASALLFGGDFLWQVIGTVGVIVLLALGTVIGNAIADRAE